MPAPPARPLAHLQLEPHRPEQNPVLVSFLLMATISGGLVVVVTYRKLLPFYLLLGCIELLVGTSGLRFNEV